MKMAMAKGLSISLPVLVLALSLSGCATDAPPPPPPPPPPAAPAGPPVALAPEISDAASVYVAYIDSVRSMSGDFSDGDNVQQKLRVASSYEPHQLSQGVIAYGAIVAMQEPSFRSALRAYASSDASRADLVSRILNDPGYAAALPSADIAARRVILAISSDGQAVYRSGSSVKQAAYDIQHQKWSKDFVTDRDGRLALAKQNSVTLKSVQSDESARLLNAALAGSGLVTHATTGQSTGGYVIQGDGTVSATTSSSNDQSSVTNPPAGQSPALALAAAPSAADKAVPAAAEADLAFDRPDLFNAPYTSEVNHALAIAAIAILGEGGNHAQDTIQLMEDRDAEKCLGMSKLNLYQCLAVAKPYYEDVFCLGQHILMDTGQCLGKMSSNALSFDPVQNIGFNLDGTMAHADAEPYLKPSAPVAKCKKGKKCKASSASSGKSSAKKPTSKSSSSKKKKRH